MILYPVPDCDRQNALPVERHIPIYPSYGSTPARARYPIYIICFYRVVLLVALTLIGLWFGLDTAKEPKRFISLAGMVVYVGISYAFSVNRRKVSCYIKIVC